MIFLNFRKIFGNLREFSENFGDGSKVIFRCFYNFLKFPENLRKSSEVFGNLRKSENASFARETSVVSREFKQIRFYFLLNHQLLTVQYIFFDFLKLMETVLSV